MLSFKVPNDTWECQHLKDLYSLQGTTGPWAQRTGPALAAAAPSWDPQLCRGSWQGEEAKLNLEGSVSAGLLSWQSCHSGRVVFDQHLSVFKAVPFTGDVNHSAQELSCCVPAVNRLWQHRWQQWPQCSLPACFRCTSGADSLSRLGKPECPQRSIPYHPKSIVLPRKCSSSYIVFNYSYVQEPAPCRLILVLWDGHFHSESLQLWTQRWLRKLKPVS